MELPLAELGKIWEEMGLGSQQKLLMRCPASPGHTSELTYEPGLLVSSSGQFPCTLTPSTPCLSSSLYFPASGISPLLGNLFSLAAEQPQSAGDLNTPGIPLPVRNGGGSYWINNPASLLGWDSPEMPSTRFLRGYPVRRNFNSHSSDPLLKTPFVNFSPFSFFLPVSSLVLPGVTSCINQLLLHNKPLQNLVA